MHRVILWYYKMISLCNFIGSQNLDENQVKVIIENILKYRKIPTITPMMETTNIGYNLLDEDDNVIKSTVTDENGKFKFEKLDVDKNYLLAIDADDDSFLEGAKLYMTNSNGEKVLLANRVSKGKFTFQSLPYTYYDDLELLVEEDESLFTVSIFGQVYQKLPGDYSDGMEIWVVDDNGNIIGKTTSDKNGKFTFEKLSPDDEYFFMSAENDGSLNMIILDEKGKVLEATKRLIDGKYRYVRLDADQNVITLINEIDEVIKIAENENFIISKN